MKIFVAVSVFVLAGVNQIYAQALSVNNDSIQLSSVEEKYYEDYLKLHPAEATNFGDNRYNDRLYNDLSDSFRAASRRLYQGTLTSLDSINLTVLNSQDVVSYDILKKELELKLEKLSLGDSLLVFNQMEGLPQDLALYGSGSVIQPFKTVRDYDNWLKRASIFPEWCDSAIIFLRKGISAKIVHPKVIVEKMILQLEGLISPDPTQSTFYGPVNLFPDSFSVAEKRRLTKEYTRLIIALINPSYKKLAGFLKKDYLPKARGTGGYVSLPGGSEMYNYYLRFSTTTNKTADEIFKLGNAEVARIESEMNKVKKKVGYNGDLKSFFKYVGTDPKFFPFKTPQQVLDAYNAVLLKITPNLGKLFKNKPKTPFEIRQTEAFRASTASIEYYQGSYEEKRPGIFYVPIVDPSKTVIYESTFAHEAIPGHHYQTMLQIENTDLPKFRRFGNHQAYAEGWALYVESLGKELGLYDDPIQYLRALSDGMLRAVRLVVDPGLHAKGWTRERAINYMMDHMPYSRKEVVAEIERYMVWPGQAVSYKIGEQKIKELRNKYEKQLESKFNLADFHDELLKDGGMPLDVLERKMDVWAKTFQ